MKKLWPGLVLVSMLVLPVSAGAADGTTVGVGTGAVAGALVGGPVGAVIGAVAGGVIGANSDRLGRGPRRRVRVAHRSRSAFRPSTPRTAKRAERGAAPVNPIRPVSVAEPGGRRQSEAPGGAWKDPR